MKTVYLCGAINGCSDEECRTWREIAKEHLAGFQVLDPMRRDYRGIEADHTGEIVNGDLEDIDQSDILLVNATRPSWGTAMELFYAHRSGKHVLVVVEPDTRVSPWLAFHSDAVATSLTEAIELIKGLD